MDPSFMADLMVTIHLSYVAFVLVGQLLILVGLALRWGWIRNLWFRLGHLLAILIVVGEATLGITCPFTVWESEYRQLAGQPFPLKSIPNMASGSCWGQLLDSVLYYNATDDVFFYCYVAFALIVIGTLILAPPRLRRKKPQTV